MFDEFVIDAISNGETEFEYDTCKQAQQLLIQFNLGVDTIIQAHGIEATGAAIWYLYGCVSGMIHDVLDESVANGFGTFYESMRSLYEHGFAKYCDNTADFRRCGGNLNTACYMLWDMDGIECRTFYVPSPRLQFVEPLVEFGMSHWHPAVQTSFLHCLGHLHGELPEFVDQRIKKFLQRTDIPKEIREYAEECQTGMIL